MLLLLVAVPDEFSYDPVSKTYGDPQRRPEIKSSTIEFIAPSEYMVSEFTFGIRADGLDKKRKYVVFEQLCCCYTWLDEQLYCGCVDVLKRHSKLHIDHKKLMTGFTDDTGLGWFNESIDYVIPSCTCMWCCVLQLRPPQAAEYLFVLDVSFNAIETGQSCSFVS